VPSGLGARGLRLAARGRGARGPSSKTCSAPLRSYVLFVDLTTSGQSSDHGGVLRSNLMKGLLAGVPPLFVYVSTASGYAHWFDGGEFVAAAADFGISHPPGHPLASIVLGAANLAPIGALSFRVALVCALLGAVAAVALFFAFESTLKVGGLIRDTLRFPLALAATWWVVGTQAWWFQAVRPEVYALQAALLCIAMERLLRVSLSGPDGDVRPLYHAALALGLALANHHYLAVLAVVPSLWLLIGIWRAWGWRPLAWSAGFLGAGLLTYLYLPLRALQEPFLNLGNPSSPGRFLWVVTAEAFQKSLSPDAVAPFGERFADVLLATGEGLHVVTLVVALLGGYFMLRVKSARKYGLFWLTVWGVYALGRAALGFVRGNPDALAYLMLSYAALAILAMFAIGVLLSALAEAVPNRPRLAPALAMLLALAATFQFVRSSEASTLANFVDTDVFDDGLRRSLPHDDPAAVAHLSKPGGSLRDERAGADPSVAQLRARWNAEHCGASESRGTATGVRRDGRAGDTRHDGPAGPRTSLSPGADRGHDGHRRGTGYAYSRSALG